MREKKLSSILFRQRDMDGRLRFGLSVLRSRCGMVFLIALRQWRPVNLPLCQERPRLLQVKTALAHCKR